MTDLSPRAAEAIADLMLSDAEMRGHRRQRLWGVSATRMTTEGKWSATTQVPIFYVVAWSEDEARAKALDVIGTDANPASITPVPVNWARP